jgi:hypothetical protein
MDRFWGRMNVRLRQALHRCVKHYFFIIAGRTCRPMPLLATLHQGQNFILIFLQSNDSLQSLVVIPDPYI